MLIPVLGPPGNRYTIGFGIDLHVVSMIKDPGVQKGQTMAWSGPPALIGATVPEAPVPVELLDVMVLEGLGFANSTLVAVLQGAVPESMPELTIADLVNWLKRTLPMNSQVFSGTGTNYKVLGLPYGIEHSVPSPGMPLSKIEVYLEDKPHWQWENGGEPPIKFKFKQGPESDFPSVPSAAQEGADDNPLEVESLFKRYAR